MSRRSSTMSCRCHRVRRSSWNKGCREPMGMWGMSCSTNSCSRIKNVREKDGRPWRCQCGARGSTGVTSRPGGIFPQIIGNCIVPQSHFTPPPAQSIIYCGPGSLMFTLPPDTPFSHIFINDFLNNLFPNHYLYGPIRFGSTIRTPCVCQMSIIFFLTTTFMDPSGSGAPSEHLVFVSCPLRFKSDLI
jgi:hypothetical protein